MKIVGAVLSYNNPAATDRLLENLQARSQEDWPILVVDNGSPAAGVSKYTSHGLPQNTRMTGGFNACIEIALREHPDLAALWLFTNDCYFVTERCPLSSMREHLGDWNDLGIVHPSEWQDVDVCYEHVKSTGEEEGLRLVWMYDIVCPLVTRRGLEAMGNQFNPELSVGWGLDYESAYQVRQAGLKVAMNYDLVINHETSSTYDQGRDNQYADRKAYYDAAWQEMNRVFVAKYGPEWKHRMQYEHNEGVGQWR